MNTPPSRYPESAPRARARALLLWLLGNDQTDIHERLAAGDALAALLDSIPAHMVPAPVQQTPGTLLDARRLLEAAAELETTARGIVAVSLALQHLRAITPPEP